MKIWCWTRAAAIVFVAVGVGLAAEAAGQEVLRKPIVRVFPAHFCPQDLRTTRVEFTANATQMRIRFEAYSVQPHATTSGWLTASFGLDNVVVLPSSSLNSSNQGPVPGYLDCYANFAQAPAVYLDSVPGAVLVETFDSGASGWDLGCNSRWVSGGAPTNTRTGTGASNSGSLQLQVNEPGTEEISTSRVVTGLTPGLTYTISFWWSANDADGQLWIEVEDVTAPPADGWADVTPCGLTSPFPAQAAMWTDINGDGKQDLLVTGVQEPTTSPFHTSENVVLVQGTGGFTRVAAPFSGAGEFVSGATAADMDGDGDPDLVGPATSQQFPSSALELCRNNAGSFTVTGGYGQGNAVTAADVDQDGRLDLLAGPPVSLYRGTGGGTLGAAQIVLDSESLHEGTNYAWGDMDGDGDLDLYVSSCRWKANPQEDTFDSACDVADVLLLNNHGTLVVVTPLSGLAAFDMQSMSAQWGDIDDDGDLDLVAVGGNCLRGVLIAKNNGAGHFTDATPAGLRCDCSRAGVTLGDFDNDGDIDIFLASATGANKILRNDGGGAWTELYPAAWQAIGVSAGIAAADFDHDGDLDVAIAVRGRVESPLDWPVPRYSSDPPATHSHLFRNELATAAHWLEIIPRCNAAFPSPIGTRINLWAGGKMQTRELHGGNGGWGQDPDEVHFGLGAATFADSLRIRWPSGLVQRIGRLSANQRLTVPEGNFITAVEPVVLTLALGDVRVAPNPQRAGSHINFRPGAGVASVIEVVDVAGRVRRVWTPAAGPDGVRDLWWDGRDGDGVLLAPGMYFLIMRSNTAIVRRTVAILR